MSNRVVLREDDLDLAALVEEILADGGYEVTHVIAIDDLLGAVARLSPCVALIDGTNSSAFDLWWLGPELSKLKVPAVAFTAHAAATQEFEADPHGFVGVITKPFDAEEFLAVVSTICWENHAARAS